MKIISRYVLREHVGPLTFALTALTSLMLLNFISRQFGELVGKGLPWGVIGEFFLLSIPFTVALTVPMSVLVAVLYAFSRLAAENEITAFKASGVSPWRMVAPAIAGGLVWSLGLLAFNDQVLPRANHRLKVLQDDISQAKPTFLLKESVINPIAEGKFYLKADKIERGVTGNMRRVVIYDLADPLRRRTIYADSGRIAMASNRRDIDLDLFHGEMQEVSTEKPGQLNRLFYVHDRIRIRDVSRDFKKSESETSMKGDREMGVCEMQERLRLAEGAYQMAKREYDVTRRAPGVARDRPAPPPAGSWPQPRGIGWAYCTLLHDFLKVKDAEAAELPPHRRVRGDTIPAADSIKPARDTIVTTTRDSALVTPSTRATPPRGAVALPVPIQPLPSPVAVPPPAPVVVAPVATPTAHVPVMATPENDRGTPMADARLAEAKLRLDLATRSRNRYDIEIHKKFSLAAACLIFVVLGAPLAVRFPRGGVGLVLGVSLVVFALYYVGLIGGEALANEGKVPPFWAMWGTNVILTLMGVVLLVRMGRDQGSGRGGDWGEKLDMMKGWLGRGPRARPSTRGKS